jgi:hypothetical protein
MSSRLVLVLALLLAAGCSPQSATASPTPTPTPTPSPSPTTSLVPSGWTTLARPADAFSISIPPTWRAIDMDPQTMSAAFQTMVEQNPIIGQSYSLEQIQAMTQQGIKVMAFDFGASTPGVFTNMSVIHQTLPSEMSMDVFSQLASAQVEVQFKMPAPPKIEAAKVGSIDGRLISYEFPLQTANGAFNALISQYVALRGKEVYILTFTTRSEDMARYRPIFDQIAANFALLP